MKYCAFKKNYKLDDVFKNIDLPTDILKMRVNSDVKNTSWYQIVVFFSHKVQIIPGCLKYNTAMQILNRPVIA